MSIQSQIDRLVQAKADLIAQIEAKGVTVPADASLDDLAALVEAISTRSDPVLQSKTVTPSTSKQTVTPDSGYDGLSDVVVNAMPTATQATPSITVSTSGLITAKATQSAGYVSAGTKQATQQLTTQGAQTITPGTADKTIASGRYLTGTQTIKGDANLKAENIAEGVSIFGVDGTHSGGSGGSGGGQQVFNITVKGLLPTVLVYLDANEGWKSITAAGTYASLCGLLIAGAVVAPYITTEANYFCNYPGGLTAMKFNADANVGFAP